MDIINRHRRIAEALFLEQATPETIQAKFGVKPSLLARWLRQPEFQDLIDALADDSRRQARLLFARCATIAAGRLLKLVQSEKEETARKAALDILQHAFGAKGASQPAVEQTARVALPAPALSSEVCTAIYRLLDRSALPMSATRALNGPGTKMAVMEGDSPRLLEDRDC